MLVLTIIGSELYYDRDRLALRQALRQAVGPFILAEIRGALVNQYMTTTVLPT